MRNAGAGTGAGAGWRRGAAKVLLVVIGGWLLATLSPLAPSASAHTGDNSDSSNFRIQLLDPGAACLHWKLLSVDGYLELRSECPGVVTVLGYEDEPYLQFSAEGVRENVNSPAAYLNRDALGEAPVPETAHQDAEASWEPRSGLPTFRWHDHRMHWMVPDPPEVDADSTRVREWTIPVRFDDDGTGVSTYLIEARGELWYDRPLPSVVPLTLVGGPMLVLTAFMLRSGLLAVGAGSGSGRPVGAAEIGSAGAAGPGGWIGRSGWGDPRLWRPMTRPLALVVGVVTTLTVLSVIDHLLAEGPPAGGWLQDGALALVVVGVGGWGIAQGWRGDPASVLVNMGAGVALLWVYGWRSRDLLGASHLNSALPDLLVRFTVASQILVVMPTLAALGIWIYATRRPVPARASLSGT